MEKGGLRIVCYFINYNDSFYIPFLAKHYGAFCERIVMYDQFSTDNSRVLAQQLGMEVRTFGNRTELNDQWYLDVKNNCWKECRDKGIDYVIVVDADEFVCVDDLLKYKQLGSLSATYYMPKVDGFNMISEGLPVDDIKEINTGGYSVDYSKQAIFSPDGVIEINYVHGCHKHNHIVIGDCDSDDGTKPTCLLLHYRMIGGVERIIERHAMYRERLSAFNKKHNMAWHYSHSDAAKKEEWRVLSERAVELFTSGVTLMR